MGRLNDTSPSNGGNGPMKLGDVRTITVKDQKTGEVIKTYTLHRTTREYVYDLCDAYNAEMSPDSSLEWFVTEGGELKLGYPQQFSVELTRQIERRNEAERARWKARQPRELREAAE